MSDAEDMRTKSTMDVLNARFPSQPPTKPLRKKKVTLAEKIRNSENHAVVAPTISKEEELYREAMKSLLSSGQVQGPSAVRALENIALEYIRLVNERFPT